MFSGRPSVPLSVRPCVCACIRPSVIHVVVLCFRDISSICWRIFAKLLSLVRLRTEMNWLDFGVKRSKLKVTAWPNTSQSFMFPLYLQYLLIDFCQTFVTDASWDTDDLITFLGQKVKVQGHTVASEAHSTRRYRRVQLFLVLWCILLLTFTRDIYLNMIVVQSVTFKWFWWSVYVREVSFGNCSSGILCYHY